MKLLVRHLEDSNIYGMMFRSTLDRDIIMSASSRELTQDMVRVDSSNLWSYSINVKEMGDDTGDVYVQFKDKNGGPGEIYVYYDVPVDVYQKWLNAPSKGHYFWQNIRNDFKYGKLTGDKRTKLKNGVN